MSRQPRGLLSAPLELTEQPSRAATTPARKSFREHTSVHALLISISNLLESLGTAGGLGTVCEACLPITRVLCATFPSGNVHTATPYHFRADYSQQTRAQLTGRQQRYFNMANYFSCCMERCAAVMNPLDDPSCEGSTIKCWQETIQAPVVILAEEQNFRHWMFNKFVGEVQHYAFPNNTIDLF